MAEDSAEERTEEATPRRKEEARKKGQVARSRDLVTTLMLITAAASLLIFADSIIDAFVRIANDNWQLTPDDLRDDTVMGRKLLGATMQGFLAVAAPMGLVVLAIFIGSLGLGGWLLSWESLAPQLSRLSIFSGVKRMFSIKALLELGKAIAKVAFVALCVVLLLMAWLPEIKGLANEDIGPAMAHALSICGWAFLTFSSVMIGIAVIDVPAQWVTFTREMRMTRQEIRDEYKDSEGKPEVKARIRQLQRRIAEARMMSQVPQADVVITNPTHYAIALAYKPGEHAAPVVLAKGVDHLAMRIRELAREHNIQQVEAPPLARAIYYSTDVDDEIPAGLYLAVAQMLAYLHQLRRWQAGRARYPGPIPEFPIPEDLRHG